MVRSTATLGLICSQRSLELFQSIGGSGSELLLFLLIHFDGGACKWPFVSLIWYTSYINTHVSLTSSDLFLALFEIVPVVVERVWNSG